VSEPYYENPIFHVSIFKVLSELEKVTLDNILNVPLLPKKSLVLSKIVVKSGKVNYEI
jgi:hypothetical protein